MQPDIAIRSANVDDLAGLESLYPSAFPDEDLLPVVRQLSALGETAPGFVALLGDEIVGHIVFTACGAGKDAGELYLLGPLAVAPAEQRQGVGKALIAEGLKVLANLSTKHVFVLGDPNYYGRHGFEAEHRVSPPYELPVEWAGAWQSRSIARSASQPSGKLVVPPVWDKRELWQP